MQQLIVQVSKLLVPHVKEGIELFFIIGRMIREFKNKHGYSGNLTELGIELAQGVGLENHSCQWYEDAAKAHKKFSDKDKNILIQNNVTKSDIVALMVMPDRKQWINQIEKKKLTPPFGIERAYNKQRIQKKDALEQTITITISTDGKVDTGRIIHGIAHIRREVDDNTWADILEAVEARTGRIFSLKAAQQRIESSIT